MKGESDQMPVREAVEMIHQTPASVFNIESGQRRDQLPRQWKQWLKAAEIDNFHWHDLRHTFASRLVMAGVDLYAVKAVGVSFHRDDTTICPSLIEPFKTSG